MESDMQKFAGYVKSEFARLGVETSDLCPKNQDAVVVYTVNCTDVKIVVASGLECRSNNLQRMAKEKVAAA